MRHRKSGRKLGRNSAHRRAMFRNMVTSLIEHERITTTEAKAKELRRFAERAITRSLRVQDILAKPEDQRTPQERAKLLHARRMAGRFVRDRQVLEKLFSDVGPKLAGRNGGYTRMLKIGPRVGDAAPLVMIELVSRSAPTAVA